MINHPLFSTDWSNTYNSIIYLAKPFGELKLFPLKWYTCPTLCVLFKIPHLQFLRKILLFNFCWKIYFCACVTDARFVTAQNEFFFTIYLVPFFISCYLFTIKSTFWSSNWIFSTNVQAAAEIISCRKSSAESASDSWYTAAGRVGYNHLN